MTVKKKKSIVLSSQTPGRRQILILIITYPKYGGAAVFVIPILQVILGVHEIFISLVPREPHHISLLILFWSTTPYLLYIVYDDKTAEQTKKILFYGLGTSTSSWVALHFSGIELASPATM